jgi:ABC-type multidrug transport system fused ATPase/permease subunit
VQVIGLGLALVAVGALINRGQLTLANLAVLIPGTAFLSGMIGAFIYYLRSLWESLAYAQTSFDFLSRSFDSDMAVVTAKSIDLPKLAAIRLNAVSYVYPNNQSKRSLTSHTLSHQA